MPAELKVPRLRAVSELLVGIASYCIPVLESENGDFLHFRL